MANECQYHEGVRCYRCGADFHDVVTRGRNAVISCVFCGAMELADYIAPRGPAAPSTVGGFRFKFGSFAGMSIAEVAEQPNGEQYLRLQSRQNAKLRPMIDEFFSARGTEKKLALHGEGQAVPLSP